MEKVNKWRIILEKLRLVEYRGYYSIQIPVIMYDAIIGGISSYWVNLIHDNCKKNVGNIFKEYCRDIYLAKDQLKVLEIHNKLRTNVCEGEILEEFYY